MNFLLLLTACASVAQAFYAGITPHGTRTLRTKSSNSSAQPWPGYKNIYSSTFEQWLDHSNTSLGKFTQTYYYNAKFYRGEGHPIYMVAPSEVNATELFLILTDHSIAGLMAQKTGGAVVMVDHRYWGNSSPFTELTTANLTYLTLENSIADMNYFAENVQLPFAQGDATPTSVPWILVGGSYSGALTAWVASKAPGTYWAYLASSAVVETISNFWYYYKQIQLGMPQNCSTDVAKVISHMDNVWATGSAKEQHELKAMFGLEELEYADDVMNALSYAPELWQSPIMWVDTGFFEWCDYVEGVGNKTNATLPGAEGVGLETALQGYATWMKNIYLPGFCANTYGYGYSNTTAECFNSHNASSPIYTDTSLSNTADRQWNWYLCNQPFGWWANGAPSGDPSIVSTLLNVEYWTRQCGLFFPTGPQGQTYGIAKGKTEAEVNTYTGGWYITNTTRLIYGNGQYDPWRDATVSSFYRPGGPFNGTTQVPNNVVVGGNHCSDLWIHNDKIDPDVTVVQQKEIAQIESWIKEFKSSSGYKF